MEFTNDQILEPLAELQRLNGVNEAGANVTLEKIQEMITDQKNLHHHIETVESSIDHIQDQVTKSFRQVKLICSNVYLQTHTSADFWKFSRIGTKKNCQKFTH